MEADGFAFTALLPLVVVFMMFSMGLDLRLSDFGRALKEGKAVVAAMSGQYILAPALAFALAFLLAPTAYIALGLIIVVAIPGGTISNAFVYVGRGNVSLSITLTAISQVIGLLSIPFFVGLGIDLFYKDVAPIELPVARTALTVTGLSLVPMLIGMFVLAKFEKFAKWLEPKTRRISVIALFIACALAVAPNAEQAVEELPNAGLIAFIMAAGGNLIGVIFARIMGLSIQDAFTIGIEVSMQNLSIAVLIAVTLLGQTELAIYTAVYALISPVTSSAAAIIYSLISKKRGDGLLRMPT